MPLSGITKRLIVSSIEVESDGKDHALTITRTEAGEVILKVRKAYENQWDASGPTFSVIDQDSSLLAAIINGSDAGYLKSAIERVDPSTLTAERPEEPRAEGEGDCTPLDIERARAANIAEERELVREQLRLDHSRDKHITATIPGCPACEDMIRPGYGDGSERPLAEEIRDNVAEALGEKNDDEELEDLPF